MWVEVRHEHMEVILSDVPDDIDVDAHDIALRAAAEGELLCVWNSDVDHHRQPSMNSDNAGAAHRI